MEGIIGAFLSIIGKGMDLKKYANLHRYHNELVELEKELLVEERRPNEEQDDAKIEYLYARIKIAVKAMDDSIKIDSVNADSK